ncbi:hypothetical protein NL676_030836 [Syzygium grande]|nr:hypothetical protein NL676_030836 [Syzygium grande]
MDSSNSDLSVLSPAFLLHRRASYGLVLPEPERNWFWADLACASARVMLASCALSEKGSFFYSIRHDVPASGWLLYCLKSRKQPFKMQNEEGQNMDLYIPRKCSATNRLITSKDHASVQINIGHLGPDGVYTNQFTTFALCGFIRAQGDADSAVDRLWQKKKAELRQ